MTSNKLSRRGFLGGVSAGLCAAALPWQRALAEAAGSDLRFVFVFNYGGWDPTHVFAPLFGNPNIDLEVDAGQATYGGIPIVEHGTRPSVSAFFQAHHARSVVLNGIGVRSLSHEICQQLMLTGTSGASDPDWGSRLAHAAQASYTLPHLVLDGLSFPGEASASVARTGAAGQLDSLLGGQLLADGDQYAGRPSLVQEKILDRYLERRSAAWADGAGARIDPRIADRFDASLTRATGLKDARFDMEFSPGDSLGSQVDAAVNALGMGISRCVSLSGPQGWDTHTNLGQQQGLWEGLFAGLLSLMDALQSTPGHREPTLADETVVVVLSEMGRTPRLNAAQGKDHWPHTSALLVGPRLHGSRVVGAFDDYYYGRGVDPSTAEVDDGAPEVTAETLGATLLAMADVDPGDTLRGIEPLTGLFG